MELTPFLTAYDPSDLPGNSIDPLGFERGYLFLADKILPGLTNVADKPRYFGLICAGSSLQNNKEPSSSRAIYLNRVDHVMRLERLWALANVFASQKVEDPEDQESALSLSGLRGVTYAKNEAHQLTKNGARTAGSHFTMLSRQLRYGAIGIYGAVADGMRLLNRKELALTPDLGQRLADAFLSETRMPPVIRRAVINDREVRLSTLTEWGIRAHVSAPVETEEAKCLYEILHRDSVRSRMATVLENIPGIEGEMELDRLQRIEAKLNKGNNNKDLLEAIQTIIRYEKSYQLVQLGFERILWLCRTRPEGYVTGQYLSGDSVFKYVMEHLPVTVDQFVAALEGGKTTEFRAKLERLTVIQSFLEQAGSACDSAGRLAAVLLNQHSDVQRGKFDHGRRKMPWIERNGKRMSLTMTLAGGLSDEVMLPESIAAHPYRLSAADALLEASRAA